MDCFISLKGKRGSGDDVDFLIGDDLSFLFVADSHDDIGNIIICCNHASQKDVGVVIAGCDYDLFCILDMCFIQNALVCGIPDNRISAVSAVELLEGFRGEIDDGGIDSVLGCF